MSKSFDYGKAEANLDEAECFETDEIYYQMSLMRKASKSMMKPMACLTRLLLKIVVL